MKLFTLQHLKSIRLVQIFQINNEDRISMEEKSEKSVSELEIKNLDRVLSLKEQFLDKPSQVILFF